jgi:hypothetical protein
MTRSGHAGHSLARLPPFRKLDAVGCAHGSIVYRHPCVAPGGCVDTLAVPMTPFLPAPCMAWDSYSYGKPPTLI